MMVGSHDKLQSETGYIDARPHSPDRGNLLQRTAGPYIWVKLGPQPMFAARPLHPRLCSLIPGHSVKLSATILAGPTVLSAVGAIPPHDGVRRRWWINVASAVSLVESSQNIGRSHHRYRPGRDSLFPR